MNSKTRVGAKLSDRMIVALRDATVAGFVVADRRTLTALERRGLITIVGHRHGELTADGRALRAAYV